MPGLAGIAGIGNGFPDTAVAMATSLGLGLDASDLHQASTPGSAMASDARPHGLWGPRTASDDYGNVAGINGELFGLYDESGGAAEDFDRGPLSRPADNLLRHYRRHGTDFIPRLRGFFSVAIWDPAIATLILATDRYALRPMYYRVRGESVLFGSEVKAILAADRELPTQDRRSIADFLLLGMPLGLRTFFEGIRLVPPASILRIKKGHESVSRYWDLRFRGERGELGKVESAAERFAGAFDSAVRDSLAGTDVLELPLSGGLDSRCLAAVASGKGNVRSYTFGSKESGDLSLGPQVARELGMDNQAWALDAQEFVEWIEPSIYITDGMYSPINASIMPVARRLPDDAQVVLDGANSFDGSYKAYDLMLWRIFPGQYTPIEQAIHICPQPVIDSGRNYPRQVFSQPFIDSAERYMEATYQEFLDSIPTDQLRNPFDTIDFLDQSNRIRRFNMMGTVLLRPFCEVRPPFFDRRVIEIVTRLVPMLRTKEKLLMGRFLSKINPTLASMPYDRTGLAANAFIAHQLLEYAMRSVRRAAGRVIPALKERPRVSIDYMSWIRNDRRLQTYMRDLLLDDRSLRRDHIRPDAIPGYIQALIDGRAENLPLVTRLISIELWYRYFLEGASPPKIIRSNGS